MNEDDLVTNIECNVEVNVQGEDLKPAAIRLAATLRSVADQVERLDIKDGFHKLKSPDGRAVGEVYFDVSEGNMFPHPDETEH